MSSTTEGLFFIMEATQFIFARWTHNSVYWHCHVAWTLLPNIYTHVVIPEIKQKFITC